MKHILVIDDDLEIRILLRKFLEMYDFLVSEAANGKRALELCKSTRFDLIIVDIFMPEKDGITFIRELQEITSEIKIIAISGGEPGHFFTSNLQLDVAKTIGAFHTLQKPFKMQELRQTIEKIFTPADKAKKGGETFSMPAQENCFTTPVTSDVNIRFIAQQDQLFKITQAIAALAEKAEKKEVTIQLSAYSANGFDASWLSQEVFKALTGAHVKIVAAKE